MRATLLSFLFTLGCTTSDPVDSPDAGVDAATCEPSLPSCASLYCAVGAISPECPHAEDTSVCWCPSPTPGWCRQ